MCATPDAADSIVAWVRLRQFRGDGLHDWHMDDLIALLPPALHLALFLFLAGLVVFMTTISLFLAIPLILISSAVLCFYLYSTFVPLLSPDCPFKTPLFPRISSTVLRATHLCNSAIAFTFRLASRILNDAFEAAPPTITLALQAESHAIEHMSSVLDGLALTWLAATSTPEVFDSIIAAIGRAEPSSEILPIVAKELKGRIFSQNDNGHYFLAQSVLVRADLCDDAEKNEVRCLFCPVTPQFIFYLHSFKLALI